MKNPRRMTDTELSWNIKDLQEVIAIQEPAARDGTMVCAKLGIYVDELHALAQEARRRAATKHCVVELSRTGGAPAVVAMAVDAEHALDVIAQMVLQDGGVDRVLLTCTAKQALAAGMVDA